MINKTVLVVSDDRVLLDFLRHNLDSTEFQIMNTKGDGRELGALLDGERPDFAVVDIMMPWMDGIELSLRLRQCFEVPVMMLSTWGAGKDKVRGLDLSTDSYLTEPFGAAELITQIEEALQRNAFDSSALAGVIP